MSRTVNRLQKEKLAALVGVRLVDSCERYLWLPCVIGRQRRKLFANLVDRVWDKIQGWESKLFCLWERDPCEGSATINPNICYEFVPGALKLDYQN
ncbi:hypothetical protein Ddye_020384 [Dipteronia dyeriana]|uniref:Uncharacterized protein n=1 Tax=Dipteronia dyeriana TaxID=168575 RepID=A0AAD9TZK8_9ROSI|nr:hypothetical protein Ddye_020384 [Dipteronia dyeriana]